MRPKPYQIKTQKSCTAVGFLLPKRSHLMASRRLRAFKRWMISQGIEYPTNALHFTDEPQNGIAVRALRNLNEGEVVAKIPKSACLTIKTSGAREIIESAGLGGYLGLSVAVMYERSLGEDSLWATYLQLLPERECVPLLWSIDEVDELLCGTELHKTVKEDKTLVFEDWKENILPLVDLLPSNIDPRFFGIEQYFGAKSLISSRSFEIDDFHGFGMVPLADLFNHKTGAEDVHFTSVAPLSESDDEADGSNISDSYAGDASDKETLSDLEYASFIGDTPLVLEMIMVKDVKVGAEVFNTYGLVGNAALLHRYGFTERDNPYDIVNIDLELIILWSVSAFSSRHSRARLTLWRKLNYSGCVSKTAEYFEISSDGRPQTELLILLYIMSLPDDAYHKLDLTISTTNTYKGSIGTIFSEKCNSLLDKNSEVSENLLLTQGVCSALMCVADKRESLYGGNSLEDDIEALEKCSPNKRKQYHSLTLRISERMILKKLRKYAGVGDRSIKVDKRASTRKRQKRT